MKNDFFFRYQLFFGLLIGSSMLCVTLLLIVRGGQFGEHPVYAASTDIKGSPSVAIAAMPVKSSTPGQLDIKVVYSDGHVGDPPAGLATYSPPPVATTGGLAFYQNPPSGYTYMYALGSDRQLYTLEPSTGWAASGAILP